MAFPLKSLLELYVKFSQTKEHYGEYAYSFRVLKDWLAPIEIPELPEFQIPLCFDGFEIDSLAYTAGCQPHIIWYLLQEIYFGYPPPTAILQQRSHS